MIITPKTIVKTSELFSRLLVIDTVDNTKVGLVVEIDTITSSCRVYRMNEDGLILNKDGSPKLFDYPNKIKVELML